jgi:CRP-like cAMP-binding protein
MKNLLLNRLSATDQKKLEPHLKKKFFDQHSVLFQADQNIRHAYFPVGAVVSLVVSLSTGEIIETAMIGMDGVVGAAAALNGRKVHSRGIIQLAGDMLLCDIGALKAAAAQSPGLLSLLVRHEQTVYTQVQQSAACFATHSVQARLCRWLLRARDLSGSDQLHFTQEYLGQMLGVRRTSVTVVAHTLQAAGLIRYARGKIKILDAEALQDSACECYGTVKAHYEQLLGKNSTHKKNG